MAGKFSSKNIFTSAAIFIIMEIAALAMLRESSTLQNIWINRSSHRIGAALWGGIDNLRSTFSLKEQNESLIAENSKLLNELQNYMPNGEESYREQSAQFKFTPALIVKLSRNNAHNYIILNKGSEDGIQANSAIVSAKGVVGIIGAVDKHHSYGLTLMNNNLCIGARIKSSGLISTLVWDGINSDGAILRDIPVHHAPIIGDTILTSGFSSIFPPDYPIGIIQESQMVDGAVLQTKVKLFQDFATLRYVNIVENLQLKEIKTLEEEMKEVQR